jgi:hypothetical protein
MMSVKRCVPETLQSSQGRMRRRRSDSLETVNHNNNNHQRRRGTISHAQTAVLPPQKTLPMTSARYRQRDSDVSHANTNAFNTNGRRKTTWRVEWRREDHLKGYSREGAETGGRGTGDIGAPSEMRPNTCPLYVREAC